MTRTDPRGPARGGLGLIAIAALIAGTAPRFVPSDWSIGAGARMIDSLAPGWLGLSLAAAALLFWTGARQRSLGLILAGLMAAVQLGLAHHRLSLPPDPDGPVQARILFFNAFAENPQGAEILRAAQNLQPDIMVFAEARPVAAAAAAALGPDYSFAAPCPEASCELWIVTRTDPLRHWRLQLNPIFADRYEVLEIEGRDGTAFFLAALHLVKPWFSGVAEAEIAQLSAQFNWFAEDQPVIAIGDFNMAPWSLPMRQLLASSDMRGQRWPIATWPAASGAFGLPIDQVLVGHGARVVQAMPFGDDLGSNHRGLLVDITF